MIQNVRYIKPYTKRKQRGRSSLSIRYCIHGNRMQFDSHTIVTDKRPVVQGERSVEHPDHSGAQMALLGTQGAAPQPHMSLLYHVWGSCGAAKLQTEKLKSCAGPQLKERWWNKGSPCSERCWRGVWKSPAGGPETVKVGRKTLLLLVRHDVRLLSHFILFFYSEINTSHKERRKEKQILSITSSSLISGGLLTRVAVCLLTQRSHHTHISSASLTS